ncbi:MULTISPECIES: amidohydrolase [unclassified Kaistella]|uniref:amidohydrolase n=1 Tax=unclassified Kaistella TaxID=2762626 RepID=UPI002735F893|nr:MULTISPECIES: amidohydrolase [unclassified Kaistella]MDP2452805.1 amidohydrolase [Kaistella sp. SH11-4b]MDP2455714.1 amidohydrolase [Kaistella sp. SH40-3]MDP2458618.1 amidohydrolase [Kaistella sp. SH19-2b]
MNNLIISGLNLNIIWKNKTENFKQIESAFKETSADVIMLPEMFSTGFYMKPEEIADRNEETLEWMKKFSKEKNIAVCGSASICEGGKFLNRFYFVEPSGNYSSYDKKHLFSYSGEDKKYSAGNERIIVNYKGWRILLQVCYDLRFAVFSRNNGDYEGILYVANWPKSRIDAWKTLLKARAIENQAYVFGLNRIGIDGNNLEYPESSYCFSADGTEISTTNNNIVTANLDAVKLKEFRNNFPFLSDRDEFLLR